MTHQLTTIESVNRFVFAGDSTFTLRSLKTGVRLTFKVEASKDGKVHFVRVLNGRDNTSDFAYLGYFRGPDYTHGNKSNITSEAPSAKAFSFFVSCLRKGQLHSSLEFYHEGRCGRCDRKLTTPDSVLTGIGPECAEIMGISQVKSPKVKKEQPSGLTLILDSGEGRGEGSGEGRGDGKARKEQKASSWNVRLQEILDEVSQKAIEGVSLR
jgi:hypothetical protein